MAGVLPVGERSLPPGNLGEVGDAPPGLIVGGGDVRVPRAQAAWRRKSVSGRPTSGTASVVRPVMVVDPPCAPWCRLPCPGAGAARRGRAGRLPLPAPVVAVGPRQVGADAEALLGR